MQAAAIPVVPLAAALATRSDLHLAKDVGVMSAKEADCTHWCPGSDATFFMASAALNAILAQLDRERK